MSDRSMSRVTRRSLLASALMASAVAALPPLGHGRNASAQAAGTPESGADLEAIRADLETFVTARMAELQVPGVAVGIVVGEDEYAAGFGVTNLDHPLPVDAETLFQIGSTTKTVTATALMRLVEQGQLDLNAPVRAYLPDFRVADAAVAEEVLLRHLVTHTPGWFGDDFTDTGRGDDALEMYVADMADLPQVAPLGRFFSYNNAGFSVAGRVIEAVTGQTYEDAVRDLVLTPLGMEHSYFFPEQVMTQAFVAGHAAPPDDPDGTPGVVAEWALPRSVNPAGGITSSVLDQLRYARFHLGTGAATDTDVLSIASITAMQTPHGPGGSLGLYDLDGVGVSWMLATIGGQRLAMHGGSTNGQQSAFVLLPDAGFGMTVLTNADAGAVLAEETVLWALERLYGLALADPVVIDLPAADLADYTGAYEMGSGLILEVSARDGALWLEASQDGELIPDGAGPLQIVGPDHAIVEYAGIPFFTDFVRDDAGNVSWIRFSGRLSARAD